MDTYLDDLATLVEPRDLRNAVHVGHSTGGKCTTSKIRSTKICSRHQKLGAGRSCDRHDPGRPSKK